MKIITIIGARPQFIKASVVSRAIKERAVTENTNTQGIKELILHTGQHFDENMSSLFFDELSIPEPEYNLGISGGTHGKNTGRMLESIETVLIKESPDKILVYGDTDSTLAGALAAAKLHIPVAHVESGLRSFNRDMPEEINRILTDHISELLFVPTTTAIKNLQKEGIPENKIRNVGDVMYDAALFYAEMAKKKSRIMQTLRLTQKTFILATVHRAENTNNAERLRNIMTALNNLSEEIPVVLPLHPRTRKYLAEIGIIERDIANIQIITPVGYLDMIMLEKNAALIATDSGGIQKEAFFHKTPCITLRAETEWTELLEMGWNTLAPPNSSDEIISAAKKAMNHQPPLAASPYGTGDSARRIVEHLSE